MTTQSARTSRRAPRWLSPERLSAGAFFVMLTLLEALPIQAALLISAAISGDLATAFGPFWLIVATLLAFALARGILGARNPIWLTLAVLPIGALAIFLFMGLSPTAYGNVPGGLFSTNWLIQLGRDANNDTSRFNGLFAIAPFVVYLGWRGLTLGAPPPRIEPTLRRYTISLAVVVLACIGGIAAPGGVQAPLQSALMTLLAVDVFTGLGAAALARRGGGRESLETSDAESARWLLTALGAAALVIVVAFALSLSINLRLAHPLIAALGALGSLLNVAISWLTSTIAYLLWIAFVKTIGPWLFQNSAFYVTPPHSVSGPPEKPAHAILAPPPQGLVTAAEVIAIVLLVALILGAIYLAVRAALRLIRPPEDPEVEEERETLDAGGLLRRQLADVLAGLRRRPAPATDSLAPGSARWLYRETLRAGAAVGVSRRPGETADEYSQRLEQIARERSESGGGLELEALTRAYDEARYGERETAPSTEAVTEARAATSALAKLRGSR